MPRGRTRVGEFELVVIVSETGEGQPSDRGVGIGLLVVLVLLLAGNLRTLLDVSAQMSRLVNLPSPRSAEQMEFTRLTLEDLVLGLVDIERRGPSPLRLTADQKASLRTLEPLIAARFSQNDRAPGPLDDQVRQTLTPEQMTHMLGSISSRERPPSLLPYLAQLHSLLER